MISRFYSIILWRARQATSGLICRANIFTQLSWHGHFI